MTSAANIGLLVMGFIPILISAIKVEKYYTNYYSGLGNMYGTILVILSFILDENIKKGHLILGIVIVSILIIIYCFSKYEEEPDIIRKVGKSTFQFTLCIFFMLMVLTSNPKFSFILSILMFFEVFLSHRLILIAEKYIKAEESSSIYGNNKKEILYHIKNTYQSISAIIYILMIAPFFILYYFYQNFDMDITKGSIFSILILLIIINLSINYYIIPLKLEEVYKQYLHNNRWSFY